MPRESGASSIHWSPSKTTDAGDYWIVRRSPSSGRATSAGPVADDDSQNGLPLLQLAAERVIDRVASAAFGEEDERDDEDEQRVFQAALAPEEALRRCRPD